MKLVWARVLALLASLVLLTACDTEINGRAVEVRSVPGGAALEFREVVRAISAQAPPPVQPPSTAPPTPQSVARQPSSSTDPITACATYKTDLDAHTVDVKMNRQGTVTTAQLVSEAQACRQNAALAPHPDGNVPADPTAQQAALATLICVRGIDDPLAGHADPKRPLAACDREGTAKYVLARTFLTGQDLTSASAEPDTQGVGWVVVLSFNSTGSKVWADYTTANVHKQVAFMLDGIVVSAPEIQERILGGDTRINGGSGGFTQQEAQQLVDRLGSR